MGLRAMAEKERVQARQFENELRKERGLVAQLRDSIQDQGMRLRQREEDIESLEVALNDLKSSMITEIEIKSREYSILQRAYDDQVRNNDQFRAAVSNLTAELDS